jgi:hypothetical protein
MLFSNRAFIVEYISGFLPSAPIAYHSAATRTRYFTARIYTCFALYEPDLCLYFHFCLHPFPIKRNGITAGIPPGTRIISSSDLFYAHVRLPSEFPFSFIKKQRDRPICRMERLNWERNFFATSPCAFLLLIRLYHFKRVVIELPYPSQYISISFGLLESVHRLISSVLSGFTHIKPNRSYAARWCCTGTLPGGVADTLHNQRPGSACNILQYLQEWCQGIADSGESQESRDRIPETPWSYHVPSIVVTVKVSLLNRSIYVQLEPEKFLVWVRSSCLESLGAERRSAFGFTVYVLVRFHNVRLR